VASVTFADEDDSGRDPLTGSALGDPRVAVRVGIALTGALVIARVGTQAFFCFVRGQPLKDWWTEWQVAFAVALPLGAPLTVMAWRDRRGRSLVHRAAEATLLAYLAWAVTESWAFFNLQTAFTRSSSVWLGTLHLDFHARLPEVGGHALGLFFAARQRGHRVVGVAYEIPTSLGVSLGVLLFWPGLFSAVGLFVHSTLIMFIVPAAERLAQRATAVVRTITMRPGDRRTEVVGR
jgi:hypothetical protein